MFYCWCFFLFVLSFICTKSASCVGHRTVQIGLQLTRCLHDKLVQMMVGPPCLVLQRRRVSAVHLAGSSILTLVHTALGWSMQQHRSNVLMHVLLTPAVTVFPFICKTATTCGVTYMTGILLLVTITLQHCLKSSDSVMQNHVCDVIFLYKKFCSK